jgi:hypothetical protein
MRKRISLILQHQTTPLCQRGCSEGSNRFTGQQQTAGGVRQQARESVEQTTFTHTVFSEHTPKLATPHGPIKTIQQRASAKRDLELLSLQKSH